MKTLAIVVLSGLIAACATQQGAHVVAGGVDPSAGVKPNGAMAASTPGTTIAASPVADHSAKNPDVINQSYIKGGYKAVHRNGELVYCRSEIITGTLLPNTICLTEAQMKTAEQNRRDMTDQLSNSRSSVDCRVYKCN